MEEIITARISELNAEQLRQVHSMLRRQQEQLAEQGQALGRQIDEIRAQRSQLAAGVAKLGADMNFIADRLAFVEAQRSSASQPEQLERSVGDLVRVDGTAPGAVLEAAARGG